MIIAFFTSSVGDTDLAKATISRLLAMGLKSPMLVIPLSAAAASRTEEYAGHGQIVRLTLAEILGDGEALSKKRLSEEDLVKVVEFVKAKNVEHAFVGVSSVVDAEVPYQIAKAMDLPCTIAYEYMFKPTPHVFWKHVPELGEKKGCQFAVPLKRAVEDIQELSPKAVVQAAGHLCIDRAQVQSEFDKGPVKQRLKVQDKEELIFVSGTTQPHQVDNEFLDALLSELCRNKYPHLQIRFGLHPGVADPTVYLQTLLHTCEKYPQAEVQFKIVLTNQMEEKLKDPKIKDHEFILRTECSGAEMSQAANKVAQAVPGALLNESALAGKPSYFHNKSAKPYLPEKWFSGNVSGFFCAEAVGTRNFKELELAESVGDAMARFILKK